MLILACLPIGDARDASAHLIEAIEQVEYVAAEDSRKFARLCQELNIKHHAKVISFFEGNESEKIDELTNILKSQKDILVATDAGAPGISDPGFLLVKACVEQGIEVETLPGATAVIPALVNSGFPIDRFVFEGFLPHKKGRQTRLKYLAQLPETIVLYESPHRIERCLNEIIEFFGENRQISFCREISKMFEEIKRGTVYEVINSMTPNSFKGEMVVVIAGYESPKKTKYNSDL